MDSRYHLRQVASVLIIILLEVFGGWCLQVTKLIVPNQVALGKAALLSCEYDLDRDSLYALSWTKDGSQFIRIRPGHPVVTYPSEGLHFKVEAANGSLILLWKTDVKSEGDYGCEITGEAPRFLTSYKQARLSVVALPEVGPRIVGGEESYRAGDRLNLTCVSGPSHPPAHLAWYINGHVASGKSEVLDAHDGLKITVTRLSLEVEAKHLTGADGAVRVRCLATVSDVYWSSSEQPAASGPRTGDPRTGDPRTGGSPSFLSHFSTSSGGGHCWAVTHTIPFIAGLFASLLH